MEQPWSQSAHALCVQAVAVSTAPLLVRSTALPFLAEGKKWSGYRIRTLQDDIEDGDAIILDDSDLVDYDTSNLPDM